MKTIGVFSQRMSSGFRKTLDALGEVTGVRFEERTFGDDAGIDGWILQEPESTFLHAVTHCERPCYIIVSRNHLVSCGDSSTISFSGHQVLPLLIRGKKIKTVEIAELKALPQSLRNGTTIASKGETPVWVTQEYKKSSHHFVGIPIPELSDGEYIFQYFFGNRFIHILPLWLFLRALTQDQRWEPPPLRACFMFDDPNLHWRTYGHINFEKILQHSIRHNYHISIATIPLDAWYGHMPTVSLFKQNPDRLSILIHGNDHIAKELSLSCSDSRCEWILRQALWRIEELERRSGLEISKVMAPPHGACSERFLKKMGEVGFEAACISRWSLRHYNDQATWLNKIGMKPSDTIVGLPVFARFRMTPTCQNSILIAALLDQPIIPIGHHHDIADGFGLLSNLSEYINSLGTVLWADMKKISRFNFSQRYDGNILQIRMLTKRIEISVPEGINQIYIENDSSKLSEYNPLQWRVLGEKMEWNFLFQDEAIPTHYGQNIEIMSHNRNPVSFDTTTFNKLDMWPMLRRQITEIRDRISPFLRRYSTKSNNCTSK